MKILVVEDNVKLAQELVELLNDEGYITECVSNVSSGIDKVGVYQYQLMILDLNLPDGSGLRVLKRVRESGNDIGVLIVTARDNIDDKITGLNLGADDYVTKPFHKAELLARVKSIIRRRNSGGSNTILVNDIKIDTMSANVLVNDKSINLTKKEFDLLLYFVYNKNRVVTKESIAEHLWGDDIDQSDSFDFIYNHIKNLRKKISKAGGKNSIQSIYGMGYKLLEL
ncbi:MAG: response regulator transcription factor [Bacteroidales bacterium]|jgi:DNA-binding response OmpR family regulator|nr:response regulator transcription factor [Bacteroidales bacterium]